MHCIRKKNIWTWSTEMSRNYRCVRFVNFSMSSLGVFSDECSTLLDMMNDIGIDKKQQLYIINWDGPDLTQFWFLFFSFHFFSFFFLSFFLIIQSQAEFVNCLYVARFPIVHSKTQIKFPLLLFCVLELRNLFPFKFSTTPYKLYWGFLKRAFPSQYKTISENEKKI